jgi:hypothetical protein
MEPGQKPEKPWFLEAAFVVPLSIFIAYVWALSLTMGVYTYFNVPYDFISLNPTIVLAKVSVLLALIASLLFVFIAPFFIGVIAENHIQAGVCILVLICEAFILRYIYIAYNPREILMWSFFVCLTVFMVVITFVYWDRIINWDRIITRQNRNTQNRPSNKLSTIQYWNYLAILIPLGAIFGGYFFFFNQGSLSAENQDTFYVIKQSVEDKKDQGVILLGNYGDYLVGVPFHRDTNIFESFVVLKMPQSDTTRFTFTREKVGKLRRVKTESVEAKP